MRSVSIVALKKDQNVVMTALQDLGAMQVSHLAGQEREALINKEVEENKVELNQCEALLKFFSESKSSLQSNKRPMIWSHDFPHLMALLSKITVLQDEIEVLAGKIEQWQVFGEFNASAKELRAKGIKIALAKFNQGRESLKQLLEKSPKLNAKIVKEEPELLWLILLSLEPIDFPGTLLEWPEQSLKSYRSELGFLKQQKASLEEELYGYCHYVLELKERVQDLRAKNEQLFELKKAKWDGELFCLHGYVLLERLEALKQALNSLSVALKIDLPKENEDVPVLLKNPSIFSCFESVVKNFTGVNYFEVDKTQIVALLFIVFGSLCLLDAGYGFLLLVLGFILAKKNIKDFGQVFMWTGGLSTILGLMCGQVFGLVFSKDILLDIKPLLTLSTEPLDCFKFSLVVGVLVMGLTNIVCINQNGWRTNATGSLLGIIAMMAMALDFAGLMPQSPLLKNVAAFFALSMLLSWIVFPEQVFGEDKKVANILWTLYSGPVSIVQDILSHMRLFGIALSGSILGLVINKISALMPFYVGVIFAPLGHVMVFFLSLLSLYIHTNRLIFLECGSKCMKGGHNYFKPFCRGT